VSHKNFAVLCAAALVFAGCTCGKDDKTPTDKLGVGEPPPPMNLKPLPVPPPLDVAPESLPGAGQELAVAAKHPTGDVPGEVRPTVTFTRPVKSLEQVEAQRAGDAAKPFAKIEPALKGEWRWLGSASAEFVPEGLVPMSTQYTVTVFKGLKALDGSELKEDVVWNFATQPLVLQQVAPNRDYRWMKADDTVNLLFNQPVKDADLLAATRFEVDGAVWKAQVMKKVSIAEERRELLEKAKKEGRRYDPIDPEQRGYKNQQWRYTLAPEKPFPLGAAIALRLDPELLHGEEGPIKMRAPEPISWRTYGPMKINGISACSQGDRCPWGPLRMRTSNELDLATLKDKLKVTPAVEIDWDGSRAYKYGGGGEDPAVQLSGKWRPGTKYKIEIAAGSKDEFGQSDSSGYSETVTFSDLNPALVTGGYLALVEATADAPKLPVEVSNLKSLDVKMWKLSTEELVKAVSRNAYDESAVLTRAPDFSERQDLKYPKNHARVHPLELKKLFGDSKTGVALVSVNSDQLEYQPKEGSRQLAQVTDLAAHIKVGPKKSLVWVTRLSTGAAVADADITVYDQAGVVKWKGKTDANGFADPPGTVAMKLSNPQYQWEYPFALITAAKDGDLSFTANTWSSGVEPYEFGLSQGWEGEAPSNASFIFADRGIYRPGDTAYVKGVIRYRTVGELRAPAEGSELQVTITDSHGEKVKTQKVKVSKYGTFAIEAVLPKESPLGYWGVGVQGVTPGGPLEANGSFRVEEYRAPQFKVDVEATKKQLVMGDTLEGKVFARYLFGGTMSDAKVKWSANRSSTMFTSSAAPDFTFAQETWWWDDREPEQTSGFFGAGEGRVDAKGELAIKAGQVEAPGEKPFSYTIEAEVEDVNRQSVAGRAEVTVHPASFYVGLRSSSGFMKVGTEVALDTVVTDVEGKKVSGRALEVTIASRTWKSVKKKDATGGFSTVSEPEEKEVFKCTLQSADAAVPCKFTPASAGFFIVTAAVKDDAGRRHRSSLGVYATGDAFVAWQRNDTDRIELVVDKASYDVGDVARVLVKSPYPEAAGVLTVEREGVLERRPLALKGSVTAVEIPITEDMVPNVFAGVVLVHPRVAKGGQETGDDPGRPAARIGLVKLSIEKKTKRLAVEVKADRAAYRPGEEVSVTVNVKDSKGKAQDGEVTLYAVDEAVLRLTAYETPDPISSIYPERPLSVRLGEPLLHLVRQRNYGEKGETQGGGGGASEGAGFRSNFKTTALWLPGLETKGGTATTKFKLPDNLTTFRLMAVVVTQGERFGSGQSDLLVNKPVLALPAMPRFARVGDSFEAGVVVHLHDITGKGDTTAAQVTVTASVEGATVKGPAEQTVTVSPTAPREVRFTFVADKAGTAKFRFKAAKGTESDGVEHKLPIELPVAIETVATYGDTTDTRVEGITPPKDVYEDMGGLEVTLASTSLGNFGKGFQQLVEYPYGCLEQQASRLVPFVAMREIAGQFGIPWPGSNAKKQAREDEFNALMRTYLFDTLDVSGEKNPDAVIASTVRSIVNLQDSDGSFRYWPSSTCVSSWQSAYATMALARAKEVGFAVPADKLAKAEAYLGKVVGGTCHPCELTCPDEVRVFAAYVLGRSKKPKASVYPEFFARREKLSLFSRALLANAMFTAGGDRKQANVLMGEILNYAKESAKGLHFEEASSSTYATLWQSDTRTTGAVLQALTNITPDHPFVSKMSRYLTGVRQGDGKWRSTQEAAFSLMALTEVLRTKEKDTPNFNATVAMGTTPVIEQKFEGRSLNTPVKNLTMAELLKLGTGQPQNLTFKKEGAGVLYYSATMKYASKSMPTAALDNGLFVQRWFEPYAGGGQTLKFYAGDLVRIRVRVGSNQERHWAAIEVPLPAGLEPVDTSLATTAKLQSSPNEEGRGMEYESESGGDEYGGEAEESEDLGPWAMGFWTPFNFTETRDTKVVLFADHLPPGVHTSSFVARATTPGTFILKPARGTLMYEPEVWGRSEGGSFEVVLPTPVSAK